MRQKEQVEQWLSSSERHWSSGLLRGKTKKGSLKKGLLSQISMPQTLEIVRLYVSEWELNVIPLKPGSKQPAIAWSEFQQRKITSEEVKKFFFNERNVGIVTGTISKLVVIDADTEETLSFLNNFYEFKNTTVVKTRRGLHYYFTVDNLPHDFGNQKIYKGNVRIDIKANGGYVVAPPSVVDGHEYVWIEKNGTGYSRPFLILSFTELQSLLEKIKLQLGIIANAEPSKKENTHTTGIEINSERLKKIIFKKYEEGHRQDVIMYMSGWLRKEGISKDTVEKIVTDICFESGDREVKMRLAAVEQAWKIEPEQLKGLSGLVELGYSEEEIKSCLEKEKTILEPLGNGFCTDGIFVYFVKETKHGTVFEMIGPYFVLKSKIHHEANILYEIEHDGKTEIMKEIKDLETIRKTTGKAIINEKRFLEWLNYETTKEIPKKFIRTQTGWKNGIFYHPAIQIEDIWNQWYWSKKIKQYRNNPEKQHELIKNALTDSRFLAIVYAFCLASVLNEPLGTNPGALFISGPAHVGKTTLAQLGINLFLPSEDIFITTHATAVGFELLMKSLKDLPLLLDECILKDLDLEKLVFMVAAKVGKVRGTKGLNISVSGIASNAIFTSEVAEQTTFKRVGSQRRILSLTIEEFKKSCFYQMDIEEIQKWNKYYGAGIDIIQFIQSNLDRVKEIKDYVEQDIDKYKLHSIYHIAISLLTAVRVFELFYQENFTNAYDYALLILDEQKREFEKKSDIVSRFKDEFAQFIVKKDNQIVVPDNPDKKIFSEIIGQREEDNIYILTKVFQEFCQDHGFEMKILIKELIRNNILIPYNYNAPRKMKKIAGTGVSTYHIKLDGINQE